MFQQWNLRQSSVVCEIVDGDDDVDGGGDFSTYDEPYVDEPEEVEVEVPNVYKTTKGTFSWSLRCFCICLYVRVENNDNNI